MSTEAGMSLLEQLKKVPDPRIERTRRHELVDMLVIALCAVICGADNWVDVDLTLRAFARQGIRNPGQSHLN